MKNQMLCVIAALLVSNHVMCQNPKWPFGMLSLHHKPVRQEKQELQFSIEGKHRTPVLKEKLMTANTMSDLIHGYPSNWISGYISTEISAFREGKKVTASGKNDMLNAEQQAILKSVEHGNDVEVNIKYTQKSHNKDSNSMRKMHVVLTAMPKSEAKFEGGSKLLNQYFEENAISKIRKIYSDVSKTTKVRFTINKEGVPTNCIILESTGQVEVDNMLLETVKKMPKWIPAQDLYGKNQSQDFLLIVGQTGC